MASFPIPSDPMNTKRILFLCLGLLQLFAITPPSFAQGPGLSEQLSVVQWVNPAVPGELTGQLLIPVAGGKLASCGPASVALMGVDGPSMMAKSDASGRFVFRGVRPGLYALSARGVDCCACLAIHVVAPEMQAADTLPSSLDVAAVRIDSRLVDSSMVQFLPPPMATTFTDITQSNLPKLRPRLFGENLFRVLQTDGGFRGQIVGAGARDGVLPDGQMTNVFLVRDGVMVDRVVSNDRGVFAFQNVPVGVYGLVSLGASGMVATGFELVDAATMAGLKLQNGNGKTFTAQPGGGSADFVAQAAPVREAVQTFSMARTDDEEQVVGEELPLSGDAISSTGAPTGGGSTGGGGGGGTGGGGLGGGLGGLGALAGLAGLAAINDGNDGGGGNALFPPPVASPVLPTPRPTGF